MILIPIENIIETLNEVSGDIIQIDAIIGKNYNQSEVILCEKLKLTLTYITEYLKDKLIAFVKNDDFEA